MSKPRLVSNLKAHHAMSVQRFRAHGDCRNREPVIHDHAAIAFYLSGSAEFYLNGTHVARAGQLVLVPEGAVHHHISIENAEMVGLSFCASCLRSDVGRELLRIMSDVQRGAPPVRSPSVSDSATLAWVFDALERELSERRPAREIALQSLLGMLVVCLSRCPAEPMANHASTYPPLVAQALSTIQVRASQGATPASIAREVGRSAAYLSELVREQTGRTVGQWLVHTRLAHARHLLLHSDDTIDTIAAQSGFGNVAYFHRLFSREMKVSPGQWRTVHRE